MGIFYLTGVGTSPGAATVPLHLIYLMVKAAENGNPKAINFFKKSGEIRHADVEYPECVIIFTSEEIITGKKPPRSGLKDEWFRLRVDQIDSIPRIIGKSLVSLIDKCMFQGNAESIMEKIFFMKVNHRNFSDCYEKIYCTIKALESKELWISYLGGTNQINLSLFLASSLTGIPTKYIYVSQDDIDKIHPDLPRPDFKNPNIEIPPRPWFDLPFIWLGLESKILQAIKVMFKNYGEIANISHLEMILRDNDLSGQFKAKLQSADIFQIENDKVIKGEGFERIKGFIPATQANNFAKWKDWGIKNDLLYTINRNRNFQYEKVK